MTYALNWVPAAGTLMVLAGIVTAVVLRVSARDAVKAAVLVEDTARTVHLACQGGSPVPIPQDIIDRLFERYQNVYGQAGDDRRPIAPQPD